ncbi:MlaD family protein [Vibrio rumoiensis]|uniref:Paraquat-inducible protein B n=1 Tax=Vibrio rumoiensis 1S-45 TaxID=1188252 RepID=A0A1E5E0S4_9VIBR|nr:MlaD family protein [Vibrio rumoiensis]OEF24096.1 paraquat-inducible protein B [Vibrio rumoiensis 1S-45]
MKNDSLPNNGITIKKERRISPLWILPIIALCLAGWLGYQTYTNMGQRVQIHFSNAQGLVEGRTTIRYQGLEVGIVKKISLSDNLNDIYVSADIYPKATKLLSANTRFWLVKPQASLSGITGLDALVSGNYIAIQPEAGDLDKKKNESFSTNYTALKEEPLDMRGQNGFNLTLTSKDLGSISVGSKIMFRKIAIGEVTSYTLAPDSSTVKIQVSIKREFAHIVNSDSRFWNVSGVNASVGFNGVDIQLDSLNALLMGAIAVDSPEGGEKVESNKTYKLYPDIKTAGRGIRITMSLPDDSNISPNAPIMYKGIEVGQITAVHLAEDKSSVEASAAVQPAFLDSLNSGTQFVLEEPKLSLTEMKNVSNFIRGNFVTLVPGVGSKTRQFDVIRNNDLLRANHMTKPITLFADDAYGLDVGTQILYRGIPVGSVNKVHLNGERVQFDAQIDTQYQNLVKSQSRFFISGSVDANLSSSGVSISMPPIKHLLAGSISFDSKGENKINSEYHLYASKSLAELAKYETSGSTSLTLYAASLPPVSIGSPILYRNLEVGKVSKFYLVDGGVKIQARIENRYKHLVTNKTVFWNHSGIKVDAGLNGLSVTASPIASLLKGGISFDNLSGVENKLNDNWILYDDYKSARQFGRQITLIAPVNKSVTKGMPIKYQGVQVGEVTLVHPNFQLKNVEITARIFPEYVTNIAKDNSHFWVVLPEISLTTGAKNIDTLLSPYIQVDPSATGNPQYKFDLDTQPQITAGTTFYLQSLNKDSLRIGTPILYRDFEVGRVTNVELGDLSDRVITTFEIQPKYTYLVRKNSIFWDVSGVNVSVGLSGASVKAGTVDSILRGGIAFSTPEDGALQPKATAKSTFVLHKEAQSEWLSWQTAIPKN